MSMASCSPGHLGTNVIAFVRAGHLWTIDPNGANAFEMVSQDSPVIGFSWSPTHQILSYRMLDTDVTKTSATHFSPHSLSGLLTDAPSTLNTLGVDGGTPIVIAFSSPDVRYSNALWNSNGTRLLYRQTAVSFSGNPSNVNWWVSQNDQPGGIAVKSLPGSYSIPSLSYAANNYKAIGNSAGGLFTTTLAGTAFQTLTPMPLPGHPLPASLERVLWQPAHQDRSFLYARSSAVLPPPPGSSETLLSVSLVLQSLSGQQSTLAMCSCTQFAWSPNGNFLLYSTSTHYSILNMLDHSSFTIPLEQGGVPYWSPDSSFLLLDEPHGLVLANMATKQLSSLLAAPQQSASAADTIPATNALLQPVANSIWAADSRHFLFLTHDRLLWQGKSLLAGKGLYTVTIDKDGRAQGAPLLVDAGNDTQAGWTYQDANTSFLY